jgi:hypothetical protein
VADDPTGKSVISLSIPICKNNSILDLPKSNLEPRRLVPFEGRIAIVTNAGRDAMDADVLRTNSA